MSNPKFEVLAYEPTKLGLLCLRRRELLCEPGVMVTEVTLDHEFLMSSYLTASEEALAEIAINMHVGDSLRVLVGGLGLGYTANVVLKSDRVECCDVIEFLPQVIEWLKDGLVPLSHELNLEERLRLICGDVYQTLAKPPRKKYDLILIDVDHSPAENLNSANGTFYTVGGLQEAKLHLAENGILGVWSYAENSPFAEALGHAFVNVRQVPITVFNNLIDVEQTDWLFFAGDGRVADSD